MIESKQVDDCNRVKKIKLPKITKALQQHNKRENKLRSQLSAN